MIFLPTMRRQIFNSFLVIIGVFGVMGGVMLAALSVTSNTGPAMLHLNFDSIEAAEKMQEAWNALRFPNDFGNLPQQAAIEQFDKYLAYEESRLTEDGEAQIVNGLRGTWERVKLSPRHISNVDFRTTHEYLRMLVEVNTSAMFARVARAKNISIIILICNGIALIITLFYAIYLSDTLATKLSLPLKAIAEALRVKPSLDRNLKLPVPSSLEMRILIRELRQLWDSLVAANKINVAELLQQKLKLETLFDSVEDAFLVLSSDQVVTHCNHLAERMIGIPVNLIVGQAFNDLSTAGDNYMMLRDLTNQKGDHEAEVEMLIDGRKYHFLVRSRRIKGRAGETVGRLILLHDITEKKQRERIRAEFEGLLTVELTEPLQAASKAIASLIEKKGNLDEAGQEALDLLNRSVTRVSAITQQFANKEESLGPRNS